MTYMDGDFALFPSVIAANLVLEQPAQTAPPETRYLTKQSGGISIAVHPKDGNHVEGESNGQEPESRPCRSDSS
jgi:hypothetical protein